MRPVLAAVVVQTSGEDDDCKEGREALQIYSACVYHAWLFPSKDAVPVSVVPCKARAQNGSYSWTPEKRLWSLKFRNFVGDLTDVICVSQAGFHRPRYSQCSPL